MFGYIVNQVVTNYKTLKQLEIAKSLYNSYNLIYSVRSKGIGSNINVYFDLSEYKFNDQTSVLFRHLNLLEIFPIFNLIPNVDENLKDYLNLKDLVSKYIIGKCLAGGVTSEVIILEDRLTKIEYVGKIMGLSDK